MFLPGVAAVLSGKTRASSSPSSSAAASGGVADPLGKGEASLSGHEESVLVSRGRAVFKPVINRIDSLELQVLLTSLFYLLYFVTEYYLNIYIYITIFYKYFIYYHYHYFIFTPYYLLLVVLVFLVLLVVLVLAEDTGDASGG